LKQLEEELGKNKRGLVRDLMNKEQAALDEVDPEYLSKEDASWFKAADYAITSKNEATNRMELNVQYWTLFAMNGAMTNNFLERTGVVGGFHEGDWEHITIEFEGPLHFQGDVNLQDWRPLMVYFAAHGAEGRWKKFELCQKENNNSNHVIVYCARHSHASYPRAGVHTRGIVTNDHTSDKGPFWRTYQHIVFVGVTDTNGIPFRKGAKKEKKNNKNAGGLALPEPPTPETQWLPSCPPVFRSKLRWGRSATTLGGIGAGNSPKSPHTKACWCYGCDCHQKIDKLTRRAKKSNGHHDEEIVGGELHSSGGSQSVADGGKGGGGKGGGWFDGPKHNKFNFF